MSHIVKIQTQVHDPVAIVNAPAWRYPVVCQPTSGDLKFDNFQGRWGEQKELDRFLQAYAVEKAKIEARRQGHKVFEQPLTNGSIKLTIHVAGGAAGKPRRNVARNKIDPLSN